jgi:hypothetical protein
VERFGGFRAEQLPNFYCEMNKKVRFDFWQIEMSTGTHVFADLLKQAMAIPTLAQRACKVGDRKLRFEHLKAHERVIGGDIIKLRMDELPGIASETTPRQDLNLRVDQGTTEETAFVFDPRLNLLIVQRNFYGCSASIIIEYFRALLGYQGPIFSHPIVSEEGFQRLQSMRVIKKLVFRVARPRRGAIARASSTSVGHAINILNDLEAMQVEVGISVGRSRTALDKIGIIKTVRDLVSMNAANEKSVLKVLVSGEDGDSSGDSFDLLEYRINSFQYVPIDIARRTMTSSSRISAAMRAYQDKYNELEAILENEDASQ